MPINNAKFERNNPGTVAAILGFLRPTPQIAFTLDELREMLAAKDIDVSKAELTSLLGSVEYGGRVVSKTVDGTTYYKYRKVMGFMPMKKIK